MAVRRVRVVFVGDASRRVRVAADVQRTSASAEDAGGADADGWRPLVLALGGDFGDARVAVRVVDERVDAETLGTALDGALESGGDEGAGGILRRWFGGIVRSRL